MSHTVSQKGEGETAYHQTQALARDILPRTLRECNQAKLPQVGE